jgi:hypothetical protein
MHQANVHGAVVGGAPVEIDSLEKRAETVSHPDRGNSDFVHCRKRSRLAIASRAGKEQGAHHRANVRCCNHGPELFPQGWRFPSCDYGNFVDKARVRT